MPTKLQIVQLKTESNSLSNAWRNFCISSLQKNVLIGYGLMTFAFVVKLPQIIKIYQEKSTAGITELYFYIDFVNILNVVAWFRHYNYPFNTYGDSVTMLVQQGILILQMWLILLQVS